MLARVKQDYRSGPVMAFAGREYVLSEWREVPAGFEGQAKNHPFLDTQPSLDEVRAHGPAAPGLPEPAAVTAVTEPTPADPPAETQPEAPEPTPQPARRVRSRAAKE